MNPESKSKADMLSEFLFDIYSHKRSGVVNISNDKFSIQLFVNSGSLIHVDGLAMVNANLVSQVCQVKGLDSSQEKKLLAIGKRAPHALGKFLIEKRLLKKENWQRFLVMRARYHVEAVIRMEKPEFNFAETLPLPPVPEDNRIQLDLFKLLVGTIRGIEDKDFFRSYMPGLSDIFVKTKNIPSFKSNFLLKPDENTILLALKHPKAIEEVLSSTNLDPTDLARSLYLLQFIGLISPASREVLEEKEAGNSDYSETINLYLDFFNIIEANFRKELGRECEKIFDRTRQGLTGKGSEIFQDVDILREERDASVNSINNYISDMISSGESEIILPTTFNNFLYPLISNMRRLLGIEITTQTLHEMLKVVGYARKFRAQDKLIDYIEKNLQDYLYQLD
jgi:hypothetical protein